MSDIVDALLALQIPWGVRRFESLSLLNLCYYEYDLEELEKKIREAEGEVSPGDLESMRSLLHRYGQAVTDFLQLSQIPRQDFTKAVNQHINLFPSEEVSQDSSSTYFDFANLQLQSPARDQVRAVLQRILPFKTVVDADEAYFAHVSHSTSLGARPEPKKVSPFVDRLARIIVAITGGLFLLVPMIVMTFVQNAHLRLVFVSVAVVWFAVSVAIVSESSNQELIGATAAYTAVLVVYVGSTSNGGGSS